MSKRPGALVFSALLVLSCGDGLRSKEKVQAAIVERLQSRTGLNVSDLDVNTTDVRFEKNQAFATVSIHPKGDTQIGHGMAMKYTLEERDGKWVVTQLNSPTGMPHMGAGAGPATAGEPLPPGHPAVGAGGTNR